MEVRIEIVCITAKKNRKNVTSLVEVRIEICAVKVCKIYKTVTSLVEVRIEINVGKYLSINLASLPLWKCGLKLIQK